jgi:hypothetical protein
MKREIIRVEPLAKHGDTLAPPLLLGKGNDC